MGEVLTTEALAPRAPAVWLRRPARTASATGLWAVFLANGGAIVYLWLHGGGITAVHGSADLFTSAGRITGLLGAYLALVQVLLLARLPWLEQLVGFDRLTVWHRRNGKLCLILILAHTALITVGYMGTDRLSLGGEISSLLSGYPGIVTATVGTGLLVVVVISSLVIARRRLPYEAWYAVHLSAYAGIALAWGHQIPTGNELTTSPAARTYWEALYLAALALLVVFRLLAPALNAWRYGLRVTAVTHESPVVTSVHLTGRRLDRIGARAGQFFLWRFLDSRRWWQAHPFSVSTAPDGRSLRLTVKAVGGYSQRLAGVRPGTRVVVEGPFGTFTAQRRRRERVLLIGGGIGITPLRGLFEEMPGDVQLIYRVVDPEDAVLRHELDEIAGRRETEVVYVTGDHRTLDGAALLSQEHLLELVPDVAQRDVYLCGPEAMMRSVTNNLRAAGVPRRHIHTEQFAL